MKCYAAYAKDIEVRNLGSSGGIYPVIATEYIKKGGIVYASVYDENLKVSFKRVDNIDDLSNTFTSKYMQSDSCCVYKKVKNDLKIGNKVLFCRTTCQVNGLYKYLSTCKVPMNSLLLIDIICHGVPSYKVFYTYMKEYSDKKIATLNMRNKELGWDWYNYSWKIQFEDGTGKIEKQSKVPFMKDFVSNIFLRPSCYNCNSKKKRYSDITIGDFWGITNTNIKLDNRYGVSCIIVNTKKGEIGIDSIIPLLDIYETDYSDILAYNPSLINSSRRPYNRKMFFNNINKCDSIELLAEKANKSNGYTKIANKLYSKLNLGKISTSDLTKKSGERTMYKIKENCTGCMACNSVCPKKAIAIKCDNEGFCYPIISLEKCINCGLCENVFPQN